MSETRKEAVTRKIKIYTRFKKSWQASSKFKDFFLEMTPKYTSQIITNGYGKLPANVTKSDSTNREQRTARYRAVKTPAQPAVQKCVAFAASI